VTGRRGRRRRNLLDDLKERRGYCHLKEEEALDRTTWKARFGRGFGPVVRQTTKWMTATYHKRIKYSKLRRNKGQMSLIFWAGRPQKSYKINVKLCHLCIWRRKGESSNWEKPHCPPSNMSLFLLRLRDTSSRNTPTPRRSEWGSSLSPDCFVSRGSISTWVILNIPHCPPQRRNSDNYMKG
jgi:hypothetical protein